MDMFFVAKKRSKGNLAMPVLIPAAKVLFGVECMGPRDG